MLAHTTAEADDPLIDANTQNEKVWQRVVACFRTTKELLLEAGQQTAILTWKCLIAVWRRKFWAFAFTIIPLLTVLALGKPWGQSARVLSVLSQPSSIGEPRDA